MGNRYPGVERMADGRVKIRWTVVVDGHRLNRKDTLPATVSLSDAARIRAERISELKAPPPQPARAAMLSTTLGEYARSWLEQRLPSLKGATPANWRDALTLHILPAELPLHPSRPESPRLRFGDIELGQLRREHLQAWVSYAERATYRPKWGAKRIAAEGEPPPTPYARATLASWWAKVTQLVRDAAEDAGLRDPTARVRGPRAPNRVRKRERRTLSPEELRALLDEIPPDWRAEAYTIAVTGMRPGELYALTWPDVDLPQRLISIVRAHVRGVVGSPKSEPRTNPIAAGLKTVLEAHRQAQLKSQSESLASGLVFPSSRWTAKRGWHRLPGSLKKVLEQAGKRAGLDIRPTPQILRRTFNTLLIEGQVDRLVLRSIVGHVDEQMTATYHHAREPLRMRAVDELEKRMKRPR